VPLFISGAVLFESINILFSKDNLFLYNLLLFFEDGLEMLGVLLAIIAIMNHLSAKGIDQIPLSKVTVLVVFFLSLADLLITYFIHFI